MLVPVAAETVVMPAMMMEVMAAMVVAAVPPAMAAAEVETDTGRDAEVWPVVIVAMPVPTAVIVVVRLLDGRHLLEGSHSLARGRGGLSRHGDAAEHQESRGRKQSIPYGHFVSFREA